MLILLEGPDGAGKTHLGTKTLRPLTYVHNGPPPAGENADDIFWWSYASLFPLQGQVPDHGHWIVDRSWPSEQVYGQLAGRPRVFDPIAHRMLERVLFSFHGVVVICLPPYPVAHRTWSQRPECELLTRDRDFATVYQHYALWGRTTSLPVLQYDYTTDTKGEALVAQLDNVARTQTINQALTACYGNLDGRVLVVGSPARTLYYEAGLRVPYVGYSDTEYWLTHEMEYLGLPERELIWVDTQRAYGPEPPADWLGDLRNLRVIIALGDIALKWALHSLQQSQTPPVQLVAGVATEDGRWQLKKYRTEIRAALGMLPNTETYS